METIQYKSQLFQESILDKRDIDLPLCWHVSLQQLYTKDVQPKYYYKNQYQDIDESLTDFFDPQTTIFGIFISNQLLQYDSKRNSVKTNSYKLSQENISTQMNSLHESQTSKLMSNLSQSIEILPLKFTDTNDKNLQQYSSPLYLKKNKDEDFMKQIRHSLQIKDIQGIISQEQKKVYVKELELQNELQQLSSSMNFKRNNIQNQQQLKQRITLSQNNQNISNLQSNSIYNQYSSQLSQSQNGFQKQKNINSERHINNNYISNSEINPTLKTEVLDQIKNKDQDLSYSILQNQQQSITSSLNLNTQASLYSNTNEFQSNQNDSNFQQFMSINLLTQSMNDKTYQDMIKSQTQETQYSQQENRQNQLMNSRLNKVNNHTLQQNSIYQNYAKDNNLSNANVKQIHDSLNKYSHGMQTSSIKNNKYFVYPNQRNHKTIFSQTSSINNICSQQNKIEPRQSDSLFQSIITQYEYNPHQETMNIINQQTNMIEQNKIFINSTLGKSKSNNTTKEPSQDLRRCSSPVFKYFQSNNTNQYFLSPDQKNEQNTGDNNNVSKENHNTLNQQEDKYQSDKGTQNNYKSNQNHQINNLSTPQYQFDSNSQIIRQSKSKDSYNSQNLSSLINKNNLNKGKQQSNIQMYQFQQQQKQQQKFDIQSNKKKIPNKLQMQIQLNQKQNYKSQLKNI